MRVVISALVVVLGLASPAYADKYLSSGAGGAGTGSDWTNAYTSCSAAIAGTSRGEVLWVADGSYGACTINKAVSGTSAFTMKKAIAASHGTETGWVSTLGDGQAEFTGIHIATNYVVVDGQGSNLTSWGFHVTIAYNSGGTSYGSSFTNTASNIELRSIHYEATTANNEVGIRMYFGGDTVTVSNVRFTRLGDDCIKIVSYNGVTMEYLWVDQRDTIDATHADAIVLTGSPRSGGAKHVLRYSFINWAGQMVFWDGVSSAHGAMDIYGNVFTGSPTQFDSKCLHVQSLSPIVGPLAIYNNTCVNSYTSFGGFHAGVTGTAKNNIFYDTSNPSWGGVSHDYNWFEIGLSTAGESNAQSGGNPFTDYGNGDFTLASATNNGNLTGSPSGNTVDRLGTTRGDDGTIDRGAFEFAGGGGPVTPTVIIDTPTSSNSYAATADPLASLGGTVTGGTITGCTGTSSATGAFTVNVVSGRFSASNVDLTPDTTQTLTVECTNSDTLSGDDALSVTHTTPSGNLPAQDNFNRTNADNLGGNWTTQTTTSPTIASNTATGAGVGSRQCAFWNAATDLTSNHYAQAVIASAPDSSNWAYVTVRAGESGSSTYDHYSLTAESGLSIIAKVINGTRTALQTINSIAWTTSDIIKLVVDGSTLRAYRNGAQIGTDQATGGELTDGEPGICLWGSFAVDDFQGDDLAAAGSNPVIAITSPTTSSTYSTTASTVTVEGTCTDADGVASVAWTNSTGGSGTATGTTTWSQASIALDIGSNALTFTCTDSDTPAQTADAVLTVTRSEANPGATKRRLRIR